MAEQSARMEGLYEFVEIVSAGSISAAAVATGMPRQTLTRRLDALEEAYGVLLLHRTTRGLTLTEAGEALYVRARRIVADAEEAWVSVRRRDGVPRGLLRVALPPGAGVELFGPTLLRWMRRYPETQLEVVVASRHVNLVAERVDLAIRAGEVREQGLIVRRLAPIELFAYASPVYLARHGSPQRVEELAHHSCILGFERGEVPTRSWPLRGGGEVIVTGRMAANELELRWLACLSGEGIALLPELMVRDALARGVLERVLASEVGAQTGLNLVYASRELLDPKVASLRDMILGEMDAIWDRIASGDGRVAQVMELALTLRAPPYHAAP